MRKILIISLSAYWMAVFVHSAVAAAPVAGEPALAAAVLLAIGHATVAVLFLWTAIVAWGGDRCDEVAGLALAVAALVLAVVAVAGGATGASAMQLAALGATYLIVKAEMGQGREPEAVDWSGEVARRLAVGAAHGSMLGTLSRRGPTEEGF